MIILNSLANYSQIDTGFIKHLTKFKLKTEHLYYLNSVSTLNDSLNYYKSKYYSNYGYDSLSLIHFDKSKTLSSQDSELLKSISKFILLNKSNTEQKDWFSKQELANNRYQNIYNCITNQNPNLNDFNDHLKSEFYLFQKYNRKKAFVAGLFSTGLPGSGKIYAGKWRSGLINLAISTMYCATTLESINKLGYKHPFSLINGMLFTAYYFSNIYGSYHTIKQKKLELKKQFIEDAINYYH